MENNSFIEFKKERDLGAIISDTFAFIRENWREYFLTVLKITGPVLVIALAFVVFYMISLSDVFSDLDSVDRDPFSFMTKIFSGVGVLILIYVVLYGLMSMASLFFIKSYIQNNGKVEFTEVKQNVFKNVWSFLGLAVLVTICVILGAFLCYLPGIYLGITLSLAFSIMIFEGKNVGDSFSHSFTLISGEWWNTFGVMIVVGLLVAVLGQVFSVPAFIYQMIKMGTMMGEEDPTAVFSLFKDPIYLILNIGSYVFQFILYSITLISSVFIYYDLNERKNLTGTFERIDSLGSNNSED